MSRPEGNIVIPRSRTRMRSPAYRLRRAFALEHGDKNSIAVLEEGLVTNDFGAALKQVMSISLVRLALRLVRLEVVEKLSIAA